MPSNKKISEIYSSNSLTNPSGNEVVVAYEPDSPSAAVGIPLSKFPVSDPVQSALNSKANTSEALKVSLSGNTAGVMAQISTGTMYLAGGSNITLSQNGNSISINGGAGGGGGSINLSAGSTSNNLTNFVLSNSNGLSFGLNGSTITGSHNALTTQTVQTQGMVSINGSTGNVSFATGSSLSSSSNGSTITFGLASNITTALQSAGAYLTTARASTDAIGLNTAVSNATVTANSSGLSIDGRGYAGTGTTGTNATFTLNSNGLQLNAGAYLTTAAQSNHSHGNPTLALTNLSGTTASNSAGLTLSLSAAAGGGGADGYNILAAGTQTASSTGTVVLSNSNNVSFGMSNNSIITASASYSQSTAPAALYDGAASISSGTARFSNSNGVSFGINGQTITASHNGLTSQSNQALSGSNGSFTFQTATFGNLNGLSFYTSNGSLVGSYTVPTQSVQTQGMVSINGGTGDISFSNSNGITFGRNASTITASHNGLTSQSNQAFSANGGSSAFQTLSFADTNGVSFTNTNGSIGATVRTDYASSNHSHGNPTLALTNLSGTTASNSAGLTLSLSAAAGGGGADGYNILAAGTQTANTTGTIAFSNSNNVSFGMSNSSIITASASYSQSTQPAVNNAAGTQTATSGTVNFVNSNGITFGMSGSSQITASHDGLTSQSIQTQNMVSVNGSTGNISLATGSSLSSSSNGSTITFGLASNITTALQSAGAYLTTAMASNRGTDFVQATAAFNGTNASGTIASNAISVSVSPQSVQTQNMVSINGSTGAISLATGSSLSSSSNGSTITFGLASNITTALQSAGAYLTTAALSNHSHGFSASGGSSAFQTLNFANSNGITFSNSNGSVIASHNGLTTARASTDAIGLNTAQSNVTWTANSSGLSLDARGYAGTNTATTGNISVTLNSSGLSLNAPAFLTTAMASNRGSDFVQANAAFAGTNASGTIASNGISVSVNAGGGATPVASASNGSFSFTTLGFSNANNVTFGTSAGSIVTASVAAPGAAAENNWFALTGANTAGNTTASGSTIGLSGINLTLSGTNGSGINISAPATSSLSATGQVSISTNGSTISIGVPEKTDSYFDNMLQQNSIQALTATSVSTGMFGRVIIQPLTPGNEFFPFNMTAETMRMNFTNSGSSNISGAFSSSWYVGIYTRVNSTQLSILNSVSTSYGLAANANNSASFLGARWLSFHSSQWSSQPVFTEGRYFFAFLARSSSNSYASHSVFGMHLGASNQRSGNMATAASSNTSYNAWHPFMGVHSLTTHTALPGSLANTEINKASAYANFIPQVVLDAGLGAVN